MKHIVKYKMHGDKIPYFILDGGYFAYEGNLIGLTRDDSNCYIPPDTELVTFHSKLDFANYIKTLVLKLFQPESEFVELTEEEKITLANSWWDARH